MAAGFSAVPGWGPCPFSSAGYSLGTLVTSIPPTPVRKATLRCKPPFRLDYTVMALRRLPQNRVDVLDGERYLRAFDSEEGPVVWSIRQEGEELHLHLHGAVRDAHPYRALVERMLGVGVDLHPFYHAAQGLPALSPLVRRMQGLKPPRFSSLWETILNGIPFQQLSLASAMAVVGRLVEATSRPVEFEGRMLYPLPSPAALLRLGEGGIASFGFSRAKARALYEAAGAISSGGLREEELEPLQTEALSTRLQALRGVGPWTAALMLLRGFRRLEVFPAGDAGARRGLQMVLPSSDPEELLRNLGSSRGMLYYHLLLAKGQVP